MPIKLLQHKSWHVYSQDNIARVKRDEAAAAAEQDGNANRTMQADAEARIDRMRNHKKRARERPDDRDGERQLERQLSRKDAPPDPPKSDAGQDLTSRGHLNFWAHLEAGNAQAGPSLERKVEKASAKSAKDAAAAAEFDNLTKVYLAKKGEGEPKGWYASADGKTDRERKGGEEATLERTYRDNETKRLVDPLALMKSYLERRDDIRSGNVSSSSSSSASTRRRPPSFRDRYPEPASFDTTTPRSRRGGQTDDLEPVVEKLLRTRRRPTTTRGGDEPPITSSSYAANASTLPRLPHSSTSSSRPPGDDHRPIDPETEAQLRVSAERAKTTALLAQKAQAAALAKRRSASSSIAGDDTPRSEFGAHEGGYGMFHRQETKQAELERRRAASAAHAHSHSHSHATNGNGWGERRDRRGEKERESRHSWARSR